MEEQRDTAPESPLPSPARRNIDTIVEVENQLLRARSIYERVGESIARFFGSLLFIIAHIVFFAVWFFFNGWDKGVKPFDPYPFSFLSLIVGIEFIFLTTFVLINQKHQIRREEQWSHLHLQLSMLAEQETTKNMQMLDRICRRLGIDIPTGDAELSELAKPTEVKAFVGEIEKSRDPPSQEINKVRAMEKELSKQSDGEGKSD